MHNYKSKNNKINYNYIVNEKHNLVGTGNIDADYNWWGKNKLFKVSKSFKIKKFVVMYLNAPHNLKFNKTYKINILFKDNEKKKLKYNIPSLSTRHYFNDYIKTNKSNIKHNNLKTKIKVIKKRNSYELKIVCDGQTLVKNYYYNNGRVTDKQLQSNAEYEFVKSFYDFFRLYNKYQKYYGKNHKNKNSTISLKENKNFFKKLNILGKKIESLSNNKLIIWFPKLRIISYTVGRLIRNVGGSNGDIWSFFSRPFLTIPNYSNLDKSGGGKILKCLLNTFLDIDDNGNLSTGDFLFNMVCLCLALFTEGASLLPKLRKIKILDKFVPKITVLLQNNKIYRFFYRNWKKISKILKSVDFVYEFFLNPLKTSFVKFLDFLGKDFKSFRILKGYYDNSLTFIKDHTFGLTTFRNNILYLKKKTSFKPKRKKSALVKIKPYLKKHPEYLFAASKAAQKILLPGYKAKITYKNKNAKTKKYSVKRVLNKGVTFFKNMFFKKF